MDILVLRALEPGDEAQALQAHAEFDTDDFMFLPQFDPSLSFAHYVALLERQRSGQDLPNTHVPATLLVADADGQIVGRTYIRHHLNDRLRHDGGHVGYGVRPQFRGRGLATQILQESLHVLASLGIEEALVTVAEANIGSRRTVERCGGQLADVVALDDGTRTCHYWVPTHP